MIKNIFKMEHVVADKLYQLCFEPDSSTVHLKEALSKFMEYVLEVEEQCKIKYELSKKSNLQEVKEEAVE